MENNANKRLLVVSPSPHVRDGDTTPKIMFSVVLALFPVIFASIYFFGLDALRILVISSVTAVAAEAACQSLRKKPVTIYDGSALVTGILLAFTLPPQIPSFAVVLGAIVAIVIGKQIFGGLGYNPFNPALVGRAFLSVSFANLMATWVSPFDAVTVATPLQLGSGVVPYAELFFGNIAGSLGETSALAILLGGVYLLYRGVLDYRICAGYLGTVFVLTLVLGHDPVYHLLAGSLLFGAIFMATDMVTSPVTPKGRWIFGIGAGLILVIIRLWAKAPEGVMYSILLMNMLTPLINRFTRPRIYGQGVKGNA
ncbi:MAG: RnfABCDGE type electron transport complex subunit D [Firmicutes bacterium]|nr:RnfABCDGE type electron transport complex subunit D [Bacillota bacterium]